mgnify:CR=1 FL=1
MKILVDAMGGDNAPLCVLQGVSQAAAEFGDGMELVLLGEEKAIRDCAKENKIDLAPFEILNCTETIDMHDDPVKAVRHKKDSSLVKGLTMLKNGEADAFVSAGSTGALHVGTSLIVRTVKGVKRPALATPMPGAKQNFLLLDCGANVECRPEMLNAFGTMGSVYAEKVMGRETPKVALVNNGAEDTKGTPTYREAHKLLKANPCIHFAGNIEPRYIMDGDVDVVVCDVPCSGLGITRKKPDIRYKDMASLAGLPAIQSAILDNASRYVRRGGTLVYSTCTVLPEENERVTDAFLRAHPDFTYDTFALPGPIGTVEGHITLWPQRHGTDGFYICRMTRKE